MKLSLIFTSIVVLLTSESVHSQGQYYTGVLTQKYSNGSTYIYDSGILSAACSSVFTAQNTETKVRLEDLPSFPNLVAGPPPNDTSDGCGVCYKFMNSENSSIYTIALSVDNNAVFQFSPTVMASLAAAGQSNLQSLSVEVVPLTPSECWYHPGE